MWLDCVGRRKSRVDSDSHEELTGAATRLSRRSHSHFSSFSTRSQPTEERERSECKMAVPGMHRALQETVDQAVTEGRKKSSLTGHGWCFAQQC